MAEPLSEPYGYALFCEDVRNEVGGSQSYIGVINSGGVIAPQYPLHMPKLGVVTMFIQDAREPIEAMDFVVYFQADGKEQEELVRASAEAQPGRDASEMPGRITKISAILMLSPLVIAEPGVMRVRAYRQGREFKLGALAFALSSQLPSDRPITD